MVNVEFTRSAEGAEFAVFEILDTNWVRPIGA